MGPQHRAGSSAPRRPPYLVEGESRRVLESATGSFDEAWLQKFVYEHPLSIPIDEIEPAFGPLVPLCCELPTKAGPIDIAFINPRGLLTLVECKLWKNPEARREVVGQMLDYAKEVCRWDYDELQRGVRSRRPAADLSLLALAQEHAEDLDEKDFVDSVSRNLRRGRFLLLLLGDGIRERAIQIAEYLDEHAHLNFALALVEMAIFRLPDHREQSFLVVPRVQMQTVEIERAVVRIEEGKAVVLPPQKARPKKVSEEIFLETLDVDAATKNAFREFLDAAKEIGFYVEPGDNSLKLRSEIHDSNFAVFQKNGTFYNCDITTKTEALGRPDIGEHYLAELAALLPNGYVKKGPSRFWWTVKVRPDDYPTLTDAMAQRDRWLKLLRQTAEEWGKVGT